MFSMKDKKVKSATLGEDATHIIIDYRSNSSLGQYIYDILVYNILVKWDNVKPLEHFKAWCNIISVSDKKQKKYKTIRYKLEIIYAFLLEKRIVYELLL
ncbi:hypothetical protein RclHR1_01010002 [Rhizophagus clarus]|uniref:Uncharacterized protein n=1 Tax=Rhizophagus clarus TaxID=94130 RepID=A0A2Z6QF18_9GLOM|nr:hypothetical protein RclHR1_01010002 [Rhizophagus clarus]GES82969.1 hypothetical protein GLOIN_2v1820645 [Rhizophagus clarus]